MVDSRPGMAFCDQCGNRLDEHARFCPSCGAPRSGAAAVEPQPGAAPETPAPPAADEPTGVREAEPPPSQPQSSGARAQTVGQLGQTPAVVAAAVIGVGTFAVVFAAGFVLAALPDASLIGFLGA